MNLVKKALAAGILVLATLGTCVAAPHSKKEPVLRGDDVTVVAHRSDVKARFEIDGIRYTSKECAFVLGELRTTHDATTRVVLLVGDDAELGTIADLSQMAVDAGFIHVQAYVYWPRNHRMAEIQFGPVTAAPAHIDRKQ